MSRADHLVCMLAAVALPLPATSAEGAGASLRGALSRSADNSENTSVDIGDETTNASFIEDLVASRSFSAAAASTDTCQTAVPGTSCYEAVRWAMDAGREAQPDWYPGVTEESLFEDYQDLFFRGGHGPDHAGAANYKGCGKPCACATAAPHSECAEAISWALSTGIAEQPAWYPGVGPGSTPEEVQELFFRGGHGPKLDTPPGFMGCPRPCTHGVPPVAPVVAPTPMPQPAPPAQIPTSPPAQAPSSPAPWGWRPSSENVGGSYWCNAEVPTEDYTLMHCDSSGSKLDIKVLTYNLFWWNLFKLRGGGAAGTLLATENENAAVPFDFMGFQECDDIAWVVGLAGLSAEFSYLQGDHALGLAYRHAAWDLIASQTEDVAEDSFLLWYGRRSGIWARFRHKTTGKTVFFINHHGPLPMNSGGLCGCEATAFDLMRVISKRAQPEDALVLVGDFNSDIHSATVAQLSKRLHRAISGTAFNGVDHIFTNCGVAGSVKEARNLGSGGSDHDAIEAILEI